MQLTTPSKEDLFAVTALPRMTAQSRWLNAQDAALVANPEAPAADYARHDRMLLATAHRYDRLGMPHAAHRVREHRQAVRAKKRERLRTLRAGGQARPRRSAVPSPRRSASPLRGTERQRRSAATRAGRRSAVGKKKRRPRRGSSADPALTGCVYTTDGTTCRQDGSP
jgi:hypothetical protein